MAKAREKCGRCAQLSAHKTPDSVISQLFVVDPATTEPVLQHLVLNPLPHQAMCSARSIQVRFDVTKYSSKNFGILVDGSFVDDKDVRVEIWGERLLLWSAKPESWTRSPYNGVWRSDWFVDANDARINSWPRKSPGQQVITKAPNYERVSRWLKKCVETHVACKTSHTESLRSIRLLDVEQRTVVKYPANCEYVTLSYVWGDTPRHRQGLGRLIEDGLPTTIQDAINVTKELGKRYLWVDSICIDQGSDTHKLEQIQKMSEIFGSSFVVIVALEGTSALEGLPRVNSYTTCHPQVNLEIGGSKLISTPPPLKPLLDEAYWTSRGWTFQEALLSTRKLVFTRHQLYFQCEHEEGTESLDQTWEPMSFPRFNIEGIDGESSRWRCYGRLVREYCSKDLTYESDALNAFSGVLRKLQETLFGEGFHFGLPIAHFEESLLWRHEPGLQRLQHADVSGFTGFRRRPGFPSWSWAGWKQAYPAFNPSEKFFRFLTLPVPYLQIETGTGALLLGKQDAPSEWHRPKSSRKIPQKELGKASESIWLLFRSKSLDSNFPCLKPPEDQDLVITGMVLRLELRVHDPTDSPEDHLIWFGLKPAKSSAHVIEDISWRLDGSFDDYFVGDSCRECDGLVLSVGYRPAPFRDSAPYVVLGLLLLQRQGDVTYRIGVATLGLPPAKIRPLLSGCSRFTRLVLS